MEAAGCCVRTALSLYIIGVYSVVRAGELTLPDVQCTSLNEGRPVHKTENHCFCYKPNWRMDMVWSALQIHVHSKESVLILPHLNCTQPEDVYEYISCWLHGVTRGRDSEDVLIDVSRLDKDLCFHIKFSNKSATYSVTVQKIWLHLRIFTVLAGILLFCLADKLSSKIQKTEALPSVAPSA